MKKLTILTSLSYLMKETAFKDILLNSDKIDRYARIYRDDFNRRLNRIKEKYHWYNFEQIEVINFFSPILRISEEQLEIENKIINLANADNTFQYIDSPEYSIFQHYIEYVKYDSVTTLVVLDITDIGRDDIIDLANAVLLYNKNDFYIKFYDD